MTKPCLTTTVLLRLHAGDGTEEQRRHVDTCDDCGRRYQRIGRELDVVSRVLLQTEEPAPIVAARRRLWVPVSAMAAALLAVVLLSSHSIRSPFQRPAPPMPTDEASVQLEDVSLTMFSIEGSPAAPGQEARLLGAQVEDEAGCEGPDWLASAECDESARADSLLNLFDARDSDL